MNNKGFTLIELLIVVAIIGIIAAIAIPSLLNALDRARQTTTVANVEILGKGVEQYKMDNKGTVPTSADIEALSTLFKTEEINNNDAVKKDGWGYDLIYAQDGAKNYTVMSYGADNASGPPVETTGIVKKFDEDIIWNKGVFTQRPEGGQKTE